MKSSFKLLVILSLVVFVLGTVSAQSRRGFADAYRDYWFTGVSVNQWQVAADLTGTNEHDVTGFIAGDQTNDWPAIVENFNWVVAENCMKCEVIHPRRAYMTLRWLTSLSTRPRPPD